MNIRPCDVRAVTWVLEVEDCLAACGAKGC